MMVESYLVVPTSGLTAAKAQKLAQYIRFVVGPVAAVRRGDVGVGPPDTDHGGRRPEGGDRAGRRGCNLRFQLHVDIPHCLERELDDLHDLDDFDHGGGGICERHIGTHQHGGTGNTGSGTGLAATGATDIVPRSAVGAALVGLGAFGRRRIRRLRRPEVRAVTTTEQHPGVPITAQPSPGQAPGHLPSRMDATNVSAWFGSNKVLERISLSMEAGQGHGADRPVRLWEVDVPADPEPDARARAHGSPFRIGQAGRCGHLRANVAGDRDSAEDRHGVPATRTPSLR